jgi:hypothetical protein
MLALYLIQVAGEPHNISLHDNPYLTSNRLLMDKDENNISQFSHLNYLRDLDETIVIALGSFEEHLMVRV